MTAVFFFPQNRTVNGVVKAFDKHLLEGCSGYITQSRGRHSHKKTKGNKQTKPQITLECCSAAVLAIYLQPLSRIIRD